MVHGGWTMSDEREPLSGPDNAWLQMGQATNLTNITGMLVFEERVTYEELVERLDERLLRFDRFRQRVHGGHRRFRRPEWAFSPGLDIETHVTHVALPEPQDKAALERFVGGLMSRPLDEDRPLWEAFLVEGVGDGNAAIFRINHSVADGFALLSVMLGLVDDPSAVEFPFDGIEAVVEADEAADGNGPGAPRSGTGADADTEGGDGGAAGLLARARSRVSAAGTAARAVGVAVDLLTRPDEPETSLRGELRTAKRAAWTDAIDIDLVKALGEEHDATVNDVMLAATAGAFRRLLVERGEDVEDLELRSSVPVNLKPMTERTESLGNYFGLIFLPIPVHTADFGERIDIVHERMDRERAMIEGVLVYLLFEFVGRAPGVVQDWVLDQFEDAATGVVTNVPGPMNTLEFAGSEVSDVLVWAPEANDQGLSLSIFSYDGSIRVGVAADAGLLDEPSRLADALEEELAERAADLE
jgi:diacylglycerol O-acyltransferase